MKPKIITSKNVAQAMGYVIAANTLFDVPYRPSPVGILTDFIDQWVLIWIGKESEIIYAATEKDSDGVRKELTRETAMYYIRQHLKSYNLLLRDGGRSSEVGWAFDGLEAGRLKRQRSVASDDNMLDVLETGEDIAMYNMSKRFRMTPLFETSISAETLSYIS